MVAGLPPGWCPTKHRGQCLADGSPKARVFLTEIQRSQFRHYTRITRAEALALCPHLSSLGTVTAQPERDARDFLVRSRTVRIRVTAHRPTLSGGDWARDPEPYRVLAAWEGLELPVGPWVAPFDWAAIEQHVRDWIEINNPFGWPDDSPSTQSAERRG